MDPRRKAQYDSRERLTITPSLSSFGSQHHLSWNLQLTSRQQVHYGTSDNHHQNGDPESQLPWSPLAVTQLISQAQSVWHHQPPPPSGLEWQPLRLQIQVASDPYDRHVSPTHAESNPSPSGVTIELSFGRASNRYNHVTTPFSVKVVSDYLVELLGNHDWVLTSSLQSSLLLPHSRRLHRYFQQTRKNATTCTFRLTLPLDGSPTFSAEGMRQWMVRYHSGTTRGWWGWLTPMQWSHLLLQSSLSSSSQPSARTRRGLWMELQFPNHDYPENVATLFTGIYWSTTTTTKTTNNNEISLRDVFLGSSSTLTPASFQIAPSPLVQEALVEWTTLNGATNTIFINATHGLDMDHTMVPMNVLSTSNPPSTTWDLYTHLERPQGPSNGGRFLLLVNQIVSPQQQQHTNNPQDATTTTCSTQVHVQQVLPRVLLRPMWHSLQVVLERHNQTTWQDDAAAISIAPTVELIQQDREDFWVLSFHTTLVESSRIRLVLEYQPSFLPSFELFPGDANRGIELPPAQATLSWAEEAACGQVEPTWSLGTTTTLYSESLLLLPPTPDMSMPFNVLSLSSTLAAFVMGALINMLIRKGRDKVKYELYPDQKPKPVLQRLKVWLRGLWQRRQRNKDKDSDKRVEMGVLDQDGKEKVE
uniref:GPI transamidase component PIG-T n=1 Tax=Entomoneis paludosa TaxID=265537 RepID=A0A7S3DZ30_9STRA